MVFEYIQFKNYKPYYGEQAINFNKSVDEFNPYDPNIILIGGLNGAGKTSLINSIFMCLYGRRFFANQEYENIIATSINKKYLLEGGNTSSVALAFNDEGERFLIELNFEKQANNKVEMTRHLYKLLENGTKQQIAASDEEFNDFIDVKIPKDVSQFFIFDAEKIRDLVGNHDSTETVEAIQKVVSLNLYQSLLADLRSLYNDESKIASSLVKDEEITELNERIALLVDRIDEGEDKKVVYTQKLESLNQEKICVEQSKRRKLINAGSSKKDIIIALNKKEHELNIVDNMIKEFAKNDLVKLILEPSIKALQERVVREKEYHDNKASNHNAFKTYDKFIEILLKRGTNPSLTKVQEQQLYVQGKDIWGQINKIIENKLNEHIVPIHDLSLGDYGRIARYSKCKSFDLKTKLDQKYQLERMIVQYKQEVETAPEEIDTRAEDARLEAIQNEYIKASNARALLSREINELNEEAKRLKGEYTRKVKLKDETSDCAKKLELLNNLIISTEEFIKQVTTLKAGQLKQEIENIIGLVFRKNDLNRIEFNDTDFTLRIFDQDDREIDLNTRSEGEKQLIALAMIWALTKVADAKMPFVIDTPLARLDSIHRSNLVNNYFTNLSEQVIILSTDTEIDQRFMRELEPYLRASYILEYSDEDEVTYIKEGYFDFEGSDL